MRAGRWNLGAGGGVVALCAWAAACGSSSHGAAPAGQHDAGILDSSISGFGDGMTTPEGSMQATCDAGCPMGTVCNQGFCEPPQAACVANADCEFDTYCAMNGLCTPYGTPPSTINDPNCQQAAAPGVFSPTVLCEFATAPPGDPFPDHLDVQATPIVVNFNRPGADGSIGPPSIVVPFTATVAGGYTEILGIIRVLKGTDCSLLANIGGTDLDGNGTVDWVNSPSAVAVGDLNGDGIAEIVAYMGDRTTAAFTLDATGKWVPLWPKVFATLADGVTVWVSTVDGTEPANTMPCDPTTGTGCSNSIWSAPSIHDLDNDGIPEIIREANVIEGNTGKLRATSPTDYASYNVGIPPVLADMNNDGKVELVTGANVWEFDPVGNQWTDAAFYPTTTSSPPGWTAIADMNPYDGLKKPEIAVATNNTLTIYSLDHTVFMGMAVMVPPAIGKGAGTGGGGPPTIADYDNDGLPEVGLAGADAYTVFDPDCQAVPRPGGKCADRTHCDFAGGPCPDYILWSNQSQDHSSNITGSSVFDFQGAGTPQAVYSDECFTRVYSGLDGEVLFSQYHSSCTWIENPVVADVDGDFRAELVVMNNLACGAPPDGIPCGQLDANGVDTQFVGTQCQTATDCVSGQCDSGYCRCTTTAQCCSLADDAKCLEAGLACAPPPAGTAGTGNTCRAPHPHGLQGIRVYKDANDRWVRSRTIWNQHAYAVTNINEDGTVPTTSAWAANWTTPSLNNFRQNVPGMGAGNAVGDLTAQAGPFFSCSGSGAVFAEPVCNRGSAPVGAGVAVGFYVGGTQVCTTNTTTPLQVGACETVSCTWSSPPTTQGMAANVDVVANDGGHTAVCYANDKGLVEGVFCVPPN
jgi:hypothetical protein